MHQDPKKTPVQPLAMSPADVASALRLTRPTIYKMMRDGVLPSVKLGGNRLIPTKFLTDLLSQAA
jgi:excisionase family DNA binding protein